MPRCGGAAVHEMLALAELYEQWWLWTGTDNQEVTTYPSLELMKSHRSSQRETKISVQPAVKPRPRFLSILSPMSRVQERIHKGDRYRPFAIIVIALIQTTWQLKHRRWITGVRVVLAQLHAPSMAMLLWIFVLMCPVASDHRARTFFAVFL